jgi:hypothetical protein
VDGINNFPVDAENLLIQVPQRRKDAIGMVIYGDYDAITLRRLAEDIRDEVANLNAISQAEVGNTCLLKFRLRSQSCPCVNLT